MRAPLLAALVAALVASSSLVAARGLQRSGLPDFKKDEVLVQFMPGANPAAEIAALMPGAKQGKKVRESPEGDLVLVQLPPGQTVAAAKDAFNRGRGPGGRASVRFVEENFVYRTSELSNDPDLLNNALWGMSGTFGINGPAAWDVQTDCSEVYVGVIDTGIDVRHPDLAANIWTNPGEVAGVAGRDDDGNGYVDDVNGYDFYNNRGAVYTAADGDEHGTHVAGTIGGVGNNGAGVVGVCWQVKIIAAKFLGPDGGYTSDAVRAVDYLTSLKTSKLLNIVASSNSWGGGGYSQALADAITRGYNADILFIAAAGNSGTTSVGYPAGYNLPGVVAVAALASGGGLASYSNRGSWVHLGAPGSGVKSTTPGNTYSTYSGTSMACPHVSGAAALYKARYPAATAAEVKGAILQSVTATPSLASPITATGGRLNAAAMLARVPGGGTPTCSCASNQYCVSGVCYACPSTCTACTSSTTCSACVPGWRGTACNLSCAPANTLVSKCTSCCSSQCISKFDKRCR